MCAVSADILSEFLEVAIHSVLYCRGVYPQGVFGRKKKYNVPVQVNTIIIIRLSVGCLECTVKPQCVSHSDVQTVCV